MNSKVSLHLLDTVVGEVAIAPMDLKAEVHNFAAAVRGE
jgi:hypothetical protein